MESSFTTRVKHRKILGLFVLVSLLLHSALIFILLRSHRSEVSAPSELVLSVELTTRAVAPAQPLSKPPPRQDSKATKKQGIILWQQGLETARKLLQDPAFSSQIIDKTPRSKSDPNGLFAPGHKITNTEIESFYNPAFNEIVVVFRYANGKTICASMREPDPLEQFDEGVWRVLIGGCK